MSLSPVAPNPLRFPNVYDTTQSLDSGFSFSTKLPFCKYPQVPSVISSICPVFQSGPTFEKAIEATDRIALVDFYADWCGPCHQLAPVLEKLTKEPSTSGSGLPLDLVKVDTESEDGIAKVRALPTVIAFRNGSPITQFVGAINEAGVKDFLSKL
ncbi:Thioredoxin Y, chloroplastic [Psilocybe cubensis]|uniref:Thioredoxin domain-containing protein n=2 Tax=Psilocybe cubensis TaxID=181762 RepID=A0A8H7Y2B4_PSICU|nr:Thioredoxin Y, chloroplastic [Psilocybe cubensis]KAH9483899.1 Thioredoxin Y, chloroplastic [Psilocybe cubensis]